jgi:hypothetical protein
MDGDSQRWRQFSFAGGGRKAAGRWPLEAMKKRGRPHETYLLHLLEVSLTIVAGVSRPLRVAEIEEERKGEEEKRKRRVRGEGRERGERGWEVAGGDGARWRPTDLGAGDVEQRRACECQFRCRDVLRRRCGEWWSSGRVQGRRAQLHEAANSAEHRLRRDFCAEQL